MTRVEWTRYNGDDIEALVAMFISGDFPAAERITPSVGDGGIDVLVKTDKTRVYQVKKFTGPLSSGQEKQVKKSIDRLCTDPRVADLQVDEWHLVMPWDATLETKKWVTEYVTEKGLPEPIWDGLTQCDLWASKYPHVVDYYIHGNAERIRETALSIVQGLRLKNIREEDIESRDIAAFADELKKTVEVLNQEDPFYYYGIHVEPQFKTPGIEDAREALANIKPGVVLSVVQGNGQVSVQVDVYAKNAVAFQLDPLKFNVVMTVRSGSEEAAALQDFVKFGSPLELPSGVSGSSALPGGFGKEFKDAAATVIPSGPISAEDRELRLVLFDPDNNQIDSLVMHRKYTTTGIAQEDLGARGMESRLTDDHAVVELLLRLDLDEKTSRMSTRIHDPQGQLAVDVVAPLRFYRKMKAPNVLAVAPRFGPIPDFREILPESESDIADLWGDVAEALSLIQEHTAYPLHFPNLWDLEEISIQEILRVGFLLRGGTETLDSSHFATSHDPAVSDEAETITMLLPWKITLQEGVVDLGYLAHAFSGSLYKRAHQLQDGLYDVWSVDGGVLVRTLSDEERKALPDIPESPAP